MPEKRYDLREIARAALGELPPKQRAELLTEMLVGIDGYDALQLLADARNAVTLRIEQLIGERYPLPELDLDKVVTKRLARTVCRHENHLLDGAKTPPDIARNRHADSTQKEVSSTPVMTAEEKLRLEQRLLFSSDHPWRDLLDWLTHQQRIGWRFASDEEAKAYIGKLVLLIGERQGRPMRGPK